VVSLNHGVRFIVKGLDEVWYDLDGVRRRIIRLVEMERLTRGEGMKLLPPVLALAKKVEALMDKMEKEEVQKRPGEVIR